MLELLTQGAKYVFIFIIYYFLFNFLQIMVEDLQTDPISPQKTGFSLMDEMGNQYPLSSVNTIGRAEDSDIIINDPFISSKHALITKKGRKLILQDLHSSNGSFINGKKIKRPVVLKEKDEIILGKRKFILVRSEFLGAKNPNYLQ